MSCKEWYLDNRGWSCLLASVGSIWSAKIECKENNGLDVLSVDMLYIFCYGYMKDTCSVHPPRATGFHYPLLFLPGWVSLNLPFSERQVEECLLEQHAVRSFSSHHPRPF
jgi:hypothetical protein